MAMIENLLFDGVQDWLDASTIYSETMKNGITDPTIRRQLSIGLISELLTRGLMEAGDYRESEFHPWGIPVGDALVKITLDWFTHAPAEMPEMWSIVWLRNTPRGNELAHAEEARRAALEPPPSASE